METRRLRITLCSGSLVVGGLAVALALVAGCGGKAITLADGGPTVGDQGPVGPAGPWTFVPDAASGAAAVSLKLETVLGDRASLLVVARGVPALQGIAFRLAFDPARLTVSKTEQSPAWTAGSWFPTVARFAPRASGELWAGLGYVGSHALDASHEVTLARLEVDLTGNDPIPLGFRPSRNLVTDPANSPVPVGWVGGTFKRAPR